MKLSKLERLQLHNQFKILAALYPSDKDHYERLAKIYQEGYEYHYDDAVEWFGDGVPAAKSQYVLEVLEMFDHLQITYDNLDDKTGINESRIQFIGFDGNREGELMSYAQFFCEDMERFTELRKPNGFNSHMSTDRKYGAMLEAWRASADKYAPTKDDLIRIGDAPFR